MRALDGVKRVEMTERDGWLRLAIDTGSNHDIRESVFKLSTSKGWSLREIRREGATLEDFFIKVTAEHQDHRKR